MNLPFRATLALTLLLLAAVPAPAQDADAWVLPRGQLEVAGTGVFTHFQRRLGGDGLGSQFAQPFQDLAQQLLGDSLARANVGTRQLWSRLTGGGPLPDSLDPGTTSLRLRADVRQVPLTVRYGWRDRITLFATLPIERRAVSSLGPFLLGGNVGLNPDAAANRAALANIDTALARYGGGLLLPTRGSRLGDSLQALLRLRGTDTLNLPTRTVDFADLRGNQQLIGLLGPGAAPFDSLSNSRGYRFGDVQVGARFLLTPGPAGWPIPDSVQRPAVRTSVGVRGRLPTGARGTMFRTELVPGGGHFGLGVDAFNDLFLSRRWLVSASASFDVLLPAEVQRLAFAAGRPFPPDTAVRTVRREPGSQLAFNVVPRWRLTRELSFAGQYAFTRTGATTYAGDVLPTPVESLDAWTAHAAGVGARYSTLRAYSLGQAAAPVEVDVSVLSAFVGSGAAPAYSQVRITGRFHPHRGLLPAPDSIPPPPPVPADTTAPPPAVAAPKAEPDTPPAVPPPPPPATPPAGGAVRLPAPERR